MNSLFSSRAKWIWLPAPHRPYNSYACFRKRIRLDHAPAAARLLITADSRYDLYLNGHWVGHGPVRSLPSPWPVDAYDVHHLLTAGENVIAVLVHHFGISTFQYLHDEAGLIVQLDLSAGNSTQTITSDASWRCTQHDGYAWPVPRVSCQQGWEEQFDARIAPGGPDAWTLPDFADSTWQGAAELRAAGEGSHAAFELRDIPFLTRQIIEPQSIRAIEIVRPAHYTFTLNPRDYINPDDKSANHIRARVLLATYIHSDARQKIDLHPPHHRPSVQWKLNGQLLSFDDRALQPTGTGVAHATLDPGPNLLLARLPELEHFTWAVINLWTEQPVAFSSQIQDLKSEIEDSTPWLCLGPFAGASGHIFDRILVEPPEIHPRATAERYGGIWSRGALTADDLAEPFTRPLTADMVSTTDIYSLCASERPDPDAQPQIQNPTALLHDTADWTIIHPVADSSPGAVGARPASPSAQGDAGVAPTTRLLLDFGNETVAFHEFEIDAPAGAVLDFHNFEFIQRDGRKNLTEGMNNSFRYICREGVQRYRTFLRRGFRFSWLSLRNCSLPIRIRFVRAIQSTYPIGPSGSFECSDELINKIWTAGVHSVRCCAEDTYTDCPTYEQTFWVGDARNEAMVHLISDGDARLSAHSLRLAGRSLARSPIVESQVPSGWQNLLPTWSFLWMRWAQEHYQFTGDAAFGSEMLEFLSRNIEGIRAHLNHVRLFEMFAWNLFDWAPMDTPAGGVVTHINCLAVLGLRQAADLAKSLKRSDLARPWSRLADQMTRAINRHLWSQKQNAYLDCIRANGEPSPIFSQQTQTAAYISGVAAGPQRRSRCLSIIDRPPKAFVRAGSPFFMFFLLEALVQEQRYEQLIDTIRNYWGKQIEAGATTFWEMYHPGEERLTRSHCHGWSAAPVVFLTQHALGVQPLASGYAQALIAPKTGDLTWAQGRVPTPRGPIDCSWTSTPAQFTLKVSAPSDTRLHIELPRRGKLRILEGKTQRKRGAARITGHGPLIHLALGTR